MSASTGIGERQQFLHGLLPAILVAGVLIVYVLVALTEGKSFRGATHPVGFNGVEIGVLFGVGSLVASISGLAVGHISRRVPARRVLLLTVAGAAIGIAATPLFEKFFSLLALACFWGINGGLAFPLILHALARAVGPEQQGMSVGIRTSVNRSAGFGVPLAMGAMIGASSMLGAFLALGGVIVASVGIIAVASRRMR